MFIIISSRPEYSRCVGAFFRYGFFFWTELRRVVLEIGKDSQTFDAKQMTKNKGTIL